MNENKTGEFIKLLRAEKNLTQKQLAERLNVTDKAISRWETGKGLPESTLLIPLADNLGVTVNELLSGERIPKEAFEERSETNLVDAYRKTEKEKKSNKRVKAMLVPAIILLAVCIALVIRFLNTPNPNYTYTGEIETYDVRLILDRLIEEDASYPFFDADTVCVDYDVNFDKNGALDYSSFTLMNRSLRCSVRINTCRSDKVGYTHYNITRFNDYSLSEDGVLFLKLCDFIGKTDFVAFADAYSDIDKYDTVNVGGSSTIFLNCYRDRIVTFGDRQNVFDGNEVRHVFNSEGMDGKYFEAIVTTLETAKDGGLVNNGQCGSVYIKR